MVLVTSAATLPGVRCARTGSSPRVTVSPVGDGAREGTWADPSGGAALCRAVSGCRGSAEHDISDLSSVSNVVSPRTPGTSSPRKLPPPPANSWRAWGIVSARTALTYQHATRDRTADQIDASLSRSQQADSSAARHAGGTQADEQEAS